MKNFLTALHCAVMVVCTITVMVIGIICMGVEEYHTTGVIYFVFGAVCTVVVLTATFYRFLDKH